MSDIRDSAMSLVYGPAQSSFSSSSVIAGKSVSTGFNTFTALNRCAERNTGWPKCTDCTDYFFNPKIVRIVRIVRICFQIVRIVRIFILENTPFFF